MDTTLSVSEDAVIVHQDQSNKYLYSAFASFGGERNLDITIQQILKHGICRIPLDVYLLHQARIWWDVCWKYSYSHMVTDIHYTGRRV